MRLKLVGICLVAVLLCTGNHRAVAAPSVSLYPVGLSLDNCGYKWTFWTLTQQTVALMHSYQTAVDTYDSASSEVSNTPELQRAMDAIERQDTAINGRMPQVLGLPMDQSYSAGSNLTYLLSDLYFAATGEFIGPGGGAEDFRSTQKELADEWSYLKRVPCHPRHRMYLRAIVSPPTFSYDAHPTLQGVTRPAARCSADVIYSTGYPPVSFHGYGETANRSGLVQWGWHEETVGNRGSGLISCTLGDQMAMAVAGFTVAP